MDPSRSGQVYASKAAAERAGCTEVYTIRPVRSSSVPKAHRKLMDREYKVRRKRKARAAKRRAAMEAAK